MRSFPGFVDGPSSRRCGAHRRTLGASRVPIEQRGKCGVRLEILVFQSVRGVDTAAVKASADQEHRLIVVASEFSAVLTDPAAREVQRRRWSVDLLLLLAPST